MCFVIAPTMAQPPVPARKQSPEELRKELNVQTSQGKELERKAAHAKKGLKDTRAQMIKTGKNIQRGEKDLLELEATIIKLGQEKKAIDTRLNKERASIAKLAMAMQRLSRMPPQAMLARPGAPLKTAQTAMLIRDILPAIKNKTDALKADLSRLDDIDRQSHAKKDRIEKTLVSLQKEETKLTQLVASREKHYRATNRNLVAKQQDIARISLQAKSLGDLVIRLNAHEAEERTRGSRPPKKTPKRNKTNKLVAIPRAGHPQLPMPGRILIAYNEPDAFGAPSKGLTIEGRPRALVVAPMGGIVRFTGYFKNYGTMVIIEHENKYHSLIAGFEKVDTLVGQNVAAGEPLGKLHKQKNGKAPKLYYELRKNSKPVNPATRLSGIG